ncbi:MAG TPA: 16S rRNA (cytosine(1402)-N(4))-methyltransferase [Candidatus Nealsonbacteria bacterium]|uniref:16S rRNA (Cytosine(1402)-N(4))-methyltransferase n=1 Tax=marine sediment metagenome TaxID=412755 RepID=A0A0F9U334_9ZZZZ|nr:16S rRNA (cytosine(1402)-N(4))-methyltransferase [Candidatus Nealsonbacteria bacterium]HEB46826.1 16S rRNA (cytosine(1402)-N(4))-methyltransferase [Candidatus Nealsonbacteria bacterium]
MIHIPVLQKEILEYLDPKSNENFIDCTFGQGGHSLAILEKNGPRGKVLGIEIDQELYKKLKATGIRKRLTLVRDSYINLKEIIKKIRPISGILFDLGMSSWHLEESGRGFSFLRNEPLDMRYNPQNPLTPLKVNGAWRKHKENKPLTGLTAEKILNFWSKDAIEKILKDYGEERYARIIAESIIEKRNIRPIKTTFQLAETIKYVVPKRYLRNRIHFATRTFQALRIAVNDELNNLERTLPQALESIRKGGRLVIISFHSLEDRIVKNFFKKMANPLKVCETKFEKAKEGLPADLSAEDLSKAGLPAPYFRQRRIVSRLRILTKKPVRPSPEEIRVNPRSRSAKLRAAVKI